MSLSLSILVPVYNEEQTLPAIMDAIASAHPTAQIVYVDDGSRDGSLRILMDKARSKDIVVSQKNGGKGSAIRRALAEAKGQYSVIQDADLEYDPKEISLLLDHAKANPGIAVFGSRFLRPNPNLYRRYLWGNKVLTKCMNLLYGCSLTDSYTCYKLLPTDAFRALNLKSNGFELEAEICAKCVKSGIRIDEIPISYKPRTLEEGKKINWKDAVKGLAMMVKCRF